MYWWHSDNRHSNHSTDKGYCRDSKTRVQRFRPVELLPSRHKSRRGFESSCKRHPHKFQYIGHTPNDRMYWWHSDNRRSNHNTDKGYCRDSRIRVQRFLPALLLSRHKSRRGFESSCKRHPRKFQYIVHTPNDRMCWWHSDNHRSNHSTDKGCCRGSRQQTFLPVELLASHHKNHMGSESSCKIHPHKPPCNDRIPNDRMCWWHSDNHRSIRSTDRVCSVG
jgi:hypothetical protein